MDAIVYKKKVVGPATHAIVIGVGHYKHLPGGAGKKFSNPGGMGQLKSPPESARAIARWLVEEYSHPDKPLASLSLLISDKAGSKFTYRANGAETTVQVPPAEMADVKPAIKAWRGSGQADPGHLLLFYFCGHGIARGPDLALLLSDFGADEDAPLDGALDFRRFRQNMDECAAREQCYFVDACRIGSELLIKNDGYAGDPVIHSVGAVNVSGRLRQAPVFYATLAGGSAYAKPGKPSLYTQALLEAIGGAGSGDQEGPWRVDTVLLQHALDFLMRDASQRLGLDQLQIVPSDDLSTIPLNVVPQPTVPVVVSCMPETGNEQATLTCENGAFKKKRKPNKATWLLRLPVDTYDFSAAIGAKAPKRVSSTIRPTYRRVILEVQP
jgi:hypothetical protein